MPLRRCFILSDGVGLISSGIIVNIRKDFTYCVYELSSCVFLNPAFAGFFYGFNSLIFFFVEMYVLNLS